MKAGIKQLNHFNMLKFDKKEHIKRMSPHAKRLVKYLELCGITFSPSDGDLDNVVFTRGVMRFSKSHIIVFYRFSGICRIPKPSSRSKRSKKHENEIAWVKVTDGMFIRDYMTTIIKAHYKI